ncbi:50S ribosomal protein L10 [Candidatus Pacearchaeota archaeon]|nr:50S ribosomal protein L10 [Candidatus Pacearchaeota archaeon]
MKQKTKKPVKEISKAKIKEVENLVKLIKDKKTVLIASIKNIPGSQFQEIVKKLRGKAVVKVPKKSLIYRALDSSGEEIKELKKHLTESFAILFSDLDAYELASELVRSKSPAKAKPGQEAIDDIVIEEGPTELVPGPAISELGALGIKIKIDKGKINIAESKTIAKMGEKISQGAAELMSKLDIKPFSIGLIPLSAYDGAEKKIYADIKIDREETVKEIKEAFAKALAFAVAIGDTNENTIKLLIAKAGRHEKALDSLINKKTIDGGNIK